MSTFHIIEDVQEQINSSALKNSSVVERQIKKKRIRTVGNFNSNFTTTATASSAKISVTSTPEGKSVVSSLSMSVERKDSIQYMPRKIPPCIIPAGQSTVIHLDNYTHFMSQRVTTTKTAIKRAEVTGEVQNQIIVPGSTLSATCSSSGSNSGSVGIVDVDLKVVLDGVTSSYRSSNKDMNKQKMLVSKTGSRKVRGRKNSLALECSQQKELNKMVDIQMLQGDPSPTLKSILRKPKPIRHRKVLKPRQSKKSKVKPKTVAEQDTTTNEGETIDEILEKRQTSSPMTQPSSESKILRPCIYTLQNKKCLSEMTCQYLHSDFPCKYYYLNLHCPLDFKCQYMHNGPLEPKLMDALRSHILELLSTKPSVVETHFIQQLHNIEDLSQRLKSFQKNEDQQPTYEVIEVMDDDGDEDQVLVIDESRGEFNSNIYTDTITPINPISNPTNDYQNTTILQPSSDKLDIVYQNFKETNTVIDEIDQKLQNLKTTSNMTPNEKIHELQTIYELLKEQEKRLPIYENLNTMTSEQFSKMYYSMIQTNLQQNEQPNIVLVNPEIVNEIQTSEFQENVVTITDDDDCSQATILNVPQENGIEYLTNENLPQNGVISGNNDMTSLMQERGINDNMNVMDQEEESTAYIETILNNTKFEGENICEMQNENNEDNCITNAKVNCNVNNEIIDNNNYGQLPWESEQSEEVETQQSLKENVDHNNLIEEINETETQEINNELNNSTILLNETLELALTSDEKEVIEGHIEEPQINEEIAEEESPPYEHITTKPVKRSRIRLRSHVQQKSEETPNNDMGEKSTLTTLEPLKPIKTRRLRLPKPSQKTNEKINNDECQINADVINKLIKSAENSETLENFPKKESSFLQDVKVPSTQNVILTKRFMKRAKNRLEQSLLNETIKSSANTDIDTNVEQNMMALHSEDNENLNRTENIDVTLLTQTSDDSNSLNPPQDPLTVENDRDINMAKLDNEATTTSNETIDKTCNKNKKKSISSEPAAKTHTKRRISFENPTSSTTSTIKEQFNLGNPHVVLTKLKSPYLLATSQKVIQADSTTTNFNPIVTSSSNLLANDKSTQKRHNFTSEHNLDSSLKENKYLKIDSSKSVRKVNFNPRKRTYSGQSNTSKEGDFHTDLSDEKLTIADAMQTSSTSSILTGNERKQAFEPSLTHVVTTHHHHHADAHQHVHKEQQENESDLRQQIENVSNKSDLQLQIQHQRQQQSHQQYQQKEVEQATTATISITKNSNNNLPHKQYQQQEQQQDFEKEPQSQQYENNNSKEEKQIANTCNPYVNIESRQIQSSTSFNRIDECERLTSNSSDKYSNETLLLEKKENVEYSVYSSLYNKLSSHSTKCQINFEDSSVDITPISSPTYGDDTIASPSPVRKSIDFRMGGEIDGRLTYPPIPYILHEIDLGKIDINKPLCIDKLKKTIQLDPRVFRTHVKKHLMTLSKTVAKTSSNSLVHSTTFNTANLSTHVDSSPSTPTVISPYDPRNRTPSVLPIDILTPSMAQQTALTPYNHMNATASKSSPLSSSSFIHTDISNAVPLALQYHSTSQPILQPQQQQTPNMFLYGCLQRSPWYQSLMSTMKIQINQSISQLVRALNNFHRERLLNPELVFDVFKIDCAGELLEIMRNLGIFVDANGIINEQRHVPSFGGRSCCNTMPVNATYSFIQQVLTPNTHCTSMTTASSTYNAACGSGATIFGPLNVNEPFVSCYIKASEPQQQKHMNDCCTTHHTHQDDNNNNNNSNCNRNYNNNNNSNGNSNNNNGVYNQNNNNNRRFVDGFKKPYDNNYNNNNGNSNYRSNNQRSYNNNPRFSKPGLNSPSKLNSSPPNSPRGGFEGGSGNSYGSGGGGGRGFGGRGGGGRFNNNRRFNNFNNNDKYNNGGGSSLSSASDSNDNRYSNKFENNNSPARASSPINSSYQTGSPLEAGAVKNTSSPPGNNSGTFAKKNSSDEECWDSDN